jgi:methylisocitrate lyase
MNERSDEQVNRASWLLSGSWMNYAARLRNLLQPGKTVMVPGAHEPLAALLAKRAGFKALYLSGAALSASRGFPDLGVLTMDELLAAARAITRAADLPLIVDGDTGYGEVLNILRLVRELDEAGVAAMHIEDQEMPKRCGHLEGKHLVPVGEMVSRLRAALKARREMLIIARTDARSVTGMEDAIARGQAYAAAGADIIFPEGLQSADEFAAFRQAIASPLMANMTEFGKTPYLTVAQFQALGYGLVIYPVSGLRLAAKAMEIGYGTLRDAGTLEGLLPRMLTREELYDVIKYKAHEAMARDLQKKS